MIDPYLPHEPETEARFLSAAIVALPAKRAEMLSGATRSYFFDDWHRWLFDELQSGYGLDGAALLDHLYRRRRGECTQLGFWLGRLLIDFDDSSVSGWVADCPLYLNELKAMADKRIKILRLLEELEAACD